MLVVLLMTVLLAACVGAAPPPADQPADAMSEQAAEQPAAVAESSEAAAPSKYNEAPALAELVQAGELPPVDERLPQEPMVVEPVDRIGKYGGTWRTALVGGQDTAWLRRTVSYDYLMRWDPQWTQSVPNIAKAVEANVDGSEYTFYLREGMKWSDGAPFTADDIVFWWDDVIMNADLTPAGPPQYMKVGDAPAVVEKIDDYTVVFKFPVPNGLFLQHLSTPDGWLPTRYPKHYLEQFHVEYNPDGVEALVAEAGATDWVNLFQLKGHGIPGAPVEAVFQNPDLPTLWAWKFITPYGEGTQVVAERNPYYWKVDTEGNQLPYIDKVVFDILEDREVLLLKVLNGEIDMMARHFNTNDNKAVLADNREAGEYNFFEAVSGGGTIGFHFNLTHQDPRMREIFQNKDFRVALSHALNRQEIIDVLLIGQGEPAQSAMCKDFAELYDEEMYTMYTEHDPELAVEYLAKAGITEKGADGFYLGPDGEPLTFVVQTTESFGHSDMAEMAVQQWRDFGIAAELRVMDRSLLYARKDANEHDVHVWGSGACSEVFLDPRHFFPFSQESTFAQAWVTWYNNPSGAGADTPPEEPPAIVKQQMELYDQIKATADRDEQIALMKEIIAIAKDQFYVIGISSEPPGYGVVKNNFFNVPASMPNSWQYPTPAPTSPEQYFFE
jgi:peptide/nickel transport system substrate-binding protein